MNASSSSIKPLTPTGGLIVAGIGLGLIGGGLIGGPGLSYGFGAGAAAGFGIAALVRPAIRRHFGQPSRFQAGALKAAITLELLAFLALGLYGHDWSFERLLLAVLVVVSAHFLIMTLSHGPMMFGLGAAGLGWLSLANLLLHLPLNQILVGDGALKFIFGAAMAAPMLSRLRTPEET